MNDRRKQDGELVAGGIVGPGGFRNDDGAGVVEIQRSKLEELERASAARTERLGELSALVDLMGGIHAQHERQCKAIASDVGSQARLIRDELEEFVTDRTQRKQIRRVLRRVEELEFVAERVRVVFAGPAEDIARAFGGKAGR